MSLLDSRTHIAVVQNRVQVPGPHGSTLTNDGAPATVHGSLQPLSAAESADFDGSVAFTQKRFITRTWPGNMFSEVTVSRAPRTEFEQPTPVGVFDCVGDPQHYDASPVTDHWEIVLKRQGS